jgi:hypothetical protein
MQSCEGGLTMKPPKFCKEASRRNAVACVWLLKYLDGGPYAACDQAWVINGSKILVLAS